MPGPGMHCNMHCRASQLGRPIVKGGGAFPKGCFKAALLAEPADPKLAAVACRMPCSRNTLPWATSALHAQVVSHHACYTTWQALRLLQVDRWSCGSPRPPRPNHIVTKEKNSPCYATAYSVITVDKNCISHRAVRAHLKVTFKLEPVTHMVNLPGCSTGATTVCPVVPVWNKCSCSSCQTYKVMPAA